MPVDDLATCCLELVEIGIGVVDEGVILLTRVLEDLVEFGLIDGAEVVVWIFQDPVLDPVRTHTEGCSFAVLFFLVAVSGG